MFYRLFMDDRSNLFATPYLETTERTHSRMQLEWQQEQPDNICLLLTRGDPESKSSAVSITRHFNWGWKLPHSCHIPRIDLLPACTMGNKLGWLQTFPSSIVHRNAWNGCHIYSAPQGYRLHPTPTLHVHHRPRGLKVAVRREGNLTNVTQLCLWQL
jgi:hypothetical protein